MDRRVREGEVIGTSSKFLVREGVGKQEEGEWVECDRRH